MVHAEREVKLICGERFDEAATIEHLAKAGRLSAPVEVRHFDQYLDTRLDELAAAGLAARCRESAGLRTVEVKPVLLAPELVMVRPEYTQAVTPGKDPGDVVRAMVERDLSLPLSEPPREVLTLVTRRRRYALGLTDCEIELCFDRVEARESHGRSAHFSEIELELRGGSEQRLRELGRTLSRRPGLSESEQSKYERARGLLGLSAFRYGPRLPVLSPQASLVDGARELARALWAIGRAHEPGVRVGLDPEHVHKMRVALRRLRTAIRVFEDAFDPEAAEAWRDELRWLGRCLGEVRDFDVYRIALARWRERFEEAGAEGWDDVEARLMRRRRRGRDALLIALASERRAGLEQLAERCLQPPTRPVRDTIEAAAPRVLARRIERCHRALARLRHDGTVERAHALRIEIKNTRYALEFLRAALPFEVDEHVDAITRVQDELGDLQDAAQTARVADELVHMAPLPSSRAALALGWLVGYGRAQAESAAAIAEDVVRRLELELRLAQIDAAVGPAD